MTATKAPGARTAPRHCSRTGRGSGSPSWCSSISRWRADAIPPAGAFRPAGRVHWIGRRLRVARMADSRLRNARMNLVGALRGSGDTHPGVRRDVNEDRFYADVERGLFIVVDGVGGHLAGGKAADVALAT